MMTKQIIFLDVDGVLNCSATWKGPHNDGLDTLDPEMCDRFAKIFRSAKDPIVVLSSTWRLHNDSGREKLNLWLKERGVEIFDQTPSLAHDPFSSRGHEIQQWLRDNACLANQILILDDDDDMLDWQKPFFVDTSFQEGLTEEKMLEAINLLTRNQK